MLRILIEHATDVTKLTVQCSFPSLQNMEETSKEMPSFSIGIDFLGPNPTRSKNEAETNLQVARFASLTLNLNKNVACF